MENFIENLNNNRLRSYEADPGLLREHAGIEEAVLAGGYGYRQVLELVQNGADAVLEEQQDNDMPRGDGQIHVRLGGGRLYVANTGAPLSTDGVDALLRSHSSRKRGDQIGRFGLGFKSLLKLKGRIDLLTRRSGAIRFDPDRCCAELRNRFNVQSAPGLRLAWALGSDERKNDPMCEDLDWAETIVRVEVASDELLNHLREEIRAFPAEFLLFFPVPTRLTLEDGEHEAREIRLLVDGADQLLHDATNVSRWRIAQRKVHVGDSRAQADATHIHARESVPVAWAMPLEGRREEVGRFWAFFPTQTLSYVPGILNAPWKLNSDRNAIIGGEWNSALMTEAAQLITETLASLATQEDPGRPLDAFPRQLDRKDEDAAPLVEALWTKLKSAPVIPDATGALRSAAELLRHPKDTSTLAETWQSLAKEGQRRQLVHPACLTRQRHSRLNTLADLLKTSPPSEKPTALGRCSVVSWFSCVASTKTDAALAVLKLAEAFSTSVTQGDWNRDRPTLAIVPTQAGKIVTPEIAVLTEESVSIPGRESVATAIQADVEARRILVEVLKVAELDDQVWESILDQKRGFDPWRSDEDTCWKEFWDCLRRAPAGVQKSYLESHSNEIRVRRRDGKWMKGNHVLLRGGLVLDDDASPNSNVLLDLATHPSDGMLMNLLGVRDVPPGDTDELWDDSPYLSPWQEACRRRYRQEQQNQASWGYLRAESFRLPQGIALLTELTGTPNASLTLQLIARLNEPPFRDDVRFGHSTQTKYPKINVPHPLAWCLLNFGEVPIGASSTAPLKALVARRHESVLSRLPNWMHVEPALDRLQSAFPTVDLKVNDFLTLWNGVMKLLITPEAVATDALTSLWISAGKDRLLPSKLRTPTGLVPLNEVFVTTSADLSERARVQGSVVVTLDAATMQLWLGKGAKDLASMMRAEWGEPEGSIERLIDVVPELADVLAEKVRDTARCHRVTKLRLKIGEASEVAPCLMWDGTLLFDSEQFAPLSRGERLKRLLAELAPSGWLAGSAEEMLQRLGDARVDERRAEVSNGESLPERLLRAVGKRPQPLLNALGEPLCQLEFVRRCTPIELAELVLAQLGPSALSALQAALQEEGLQPPARWNTVAALAFVTSIGFPAEFASSAEARRVPEEMVTGPIELPSLHDFQQEVLEGLAKLLANGTIRRRAVVSLPTGGGKTRVTVEAAVRLVLAPPGQTRSVLWIAQTDELCEQAVQAFRQVWVNLGSQRTDLRIVRLWGGNPNPAGHETGKPVVVVASIQTLNHRFGADGIEWLRTPGLVVVDECHHAITPSYSSLLRWLDAEAPRSGSSEKDEPPIIGLSATPFRTADEESHRLARRFDQCWLPHYQDQLYARLRRQGVLANPLYESFDSGARLTDEELSRFAGLGSSWEGLDFENLLEAVNQRLAADSRRNERLVQCIRESREEFILFFTNSVAHAEEMAARLNLEGVPAAAVSGNTPTVVRRWFLERFQAGAIRVLCNHSVLSTGFDAPRTDMVLIARQVFSPVRYMQMVGRGLRGEKNGGTPSCRIVTVMDNLGRFQDRHPYHYCRQYFSSMASLSAEATASFSEIADG